MASISDAETFMHFIYISTIIFVCCGNSNLVPNGSLLPLQPEILMELVILTFSLLLCLGKMLCIEDSFKRLGTLKECVFY